MLLTCSYLGAHEYDVAATYRDYAQGHPHPPAPLPQKPPPEFHGSESFDSSQEYNQGYSPSQQSQYPLTARNEVRSNQEILTASAQRTSMSLASGLSWSFSMTPHRFQSSWETMDQNGGASRTLETTVTRIPGVSVITEHLQARAFTVIATGNTGSQLKVYACARSIRTSTATSEAATFLLEMVFTVASQGMSACPLCLTFKCESADQLSFFVQSLNLSTLVETEKDEVLAT